MSKFHTGWRRLALTLALVGPLVLAACGGDDDEPNTPTPAATTAPAAASPTPPPPPSPLASPAASPIASPVASPAASPAATSNEQAMTRAEFQARLLQAFPMVAPAKTGGTVILGEAADISTVNPILSTDTLSFAINGAMYETLIGVSPIDGQPVPGLADSWVVAPDGVTFTFRLNERAAWHDGVDLTAEDVKFSFDAVLDPNTGSLYRSIVREAVASYRVVDPDTFEIVARDRLVTFLYEGPGAVFIMPKHVWESVGFESWSFDGGSTGQDPSRVVGSGPFKFKEWVQGDHITIVRNDAYWDQVPHIDQLTLQVQPNADAAVLALQNKQIDVLEIIPPEQTEAVQKTEGLKVDIYDFFQFTVYTFNLDPERTPLFQDKAVRQALFTALDRDSITRNIFLGFGEAAVGTQPKLSPAYAPERMTPSFAFDPAKARELLASAGWTDSNDNGTVDKDGKELRFELMYEGGSSTVDQIVAYMQQAWKEVGVKMEPRSVGGGVLIDSLQSFDFEVAFLAFSLSADGTQTSLFGCEQYETGLNFMRYCNETWDELDRLQKREFDPAKRVELLIQQSRIIWEDQPIGVVRFGVARTGYTTRLHNFHPNGYGFLWSLPYVWVDE